MNQQQRAELDRLKERQAHLSEELTRLSLELKQLEQRLATPSAVEKPTVAASSLPEATTTSAPAVIKTQPMEPPPLPPILPAATAIPTATQIPAAAALPVQPRPEVETHRLEATPAKQFETSPAEAAAGTSAPAPSRQQPRTLPRNEEAAPNAPTRPTNGKDLELRLGTFWLVRVGIVMVVTGLVFFGHLAYQNYVRQLGPGGKVILLYVATAALLGAGWWWQRQAAKESLKNFGQVLFAGGLAVLYFTTYAAHHVEQLLVIHSALLDGVLLLGCAGFMVAIAEAKKSEVLALFAVGLAYYSSIITRVGYFTLYSNLVLTAAAVFFLVRNRWAVLSFGSLVASYLGYGFWRFLDANGWHWPAVQGIWSGTYFLVSYWLVFTAGVFLTREKPFAGQNRASFLTLNNAAFLAMFLLTMLQVHQGGFWKFALIYGGALVGLAEAARRFLPTEPLARNSYLSQGLLLVTIGLISKFSGLQLALVLGMESVVLLMSGQQRKNLVLLVGAFISAGLAVGWALDGMQQRQAPGVYLAIGLAGLMLLNTILVSRQDAPPQRLRLRAGPGYFTVLALVVVLAATWNNAPRESFAALVAVEATTVILSIYLLGIPELSVLGGAYLAVGQLVWSYDVMAGHLLLPWWSSVLVVLLSVVLCEWWFRQKLPSLTLANGAEAKEARLLPALLKNVVLLAAMVLAVRNAGGLSLDKLNETPGSIWLAVTLAAITLGDALLAARHENTAGSLPLRPQPTYATALALIIWLAISWHLTPREQFPLVLGVEAAILTFSIYLLGVREITFLGQGYLVLAQLSWIFDAMTGGNLAPWWNALLLLGLSFGLSHWWQRQKVVALRPEARYLWQGIYALAIVAMLYFRLKPEVHPAGWLVLSSLLAIGMTAYGVWTRAWPIALCGQLFFAVSSLGFFAQLAEGKPAWQYPLATIGSLALLSAAAVAWFTRHPTAASQSREPLLGLALFYRWAALAMSLVWVSEYIPARHRVWFLSVLGVLAFGWSGWRRSREALLFSAAFSLNALVLFWRPWLSGGEVNWAELVLVLMLLGEQQLAYRFPKRYPVERGIHVTAITIGALSLWLFISRWVMQLESVSGGSYLTASWSLLGLGLFTAGFALQEKIYRWLGLGVLGCALGRVVLFDVWKLETTYRILSFMALGIVLLVLGFIYNKYQEKIRSWL